MAAPRHLACGAVAASAAARRAARAMLQAAPCVAASTHPADAPCPTDRAMAPSTSSAVHSAGAYATSPRCRETHQPGRNIAARWPPSMACALKPSLRHRLSIQGRPAIIGSIASDESCSGPFRGVRQSAMVRASNEQSALPVRRWLTALVRAGAEAASTTPTTIASIAMWVATERRSPMSPRQAHASSAPAAAGQAAGPAATGKAGERARVRSPSAGVRTTLPASAISVAQATMAGSRKSTPPPRSEAISEPAASRPAASESAR